MLCTYNANISEGRTGQEEGFICISAYGLTREI